MKLLYHQFHIDYQPDPIHTVADVVEHVVSLLIGKLDVNKLKAAEEEMNTIKKRKISSKLTVLSKDDLIIGNKSCKSLRFPKEVSFTIRYKKILARKHYVE